jgi:drug/metabolite transporter (DMT)-like permease
MAARPSVSPTPRFSRTAFLAASFSVTYLVWGSTYLAAKVGLEEIPPTVLVGVRTLLGAVIFAVAVAVFGGRSERNGRTDMRSQVVRASIAGVLLFAGGHALLYEAQQRVPSSLAAIVIATIPLWLLAFDAVRARRTPGWLPSLAGLAGVGGVALLMWSSAGSMAQLALSDALRLLVAAALWAAGSLFARDATGALSPLGSLTVQFTAGGLAVLAMSAFNGELARWSPTATSARGYLALAYLVVFGTALGFAAYLYLLRTTSAAVAGSYALVNPVVALALGATLGGERLTPRMLLAAVVVLGSVALLHGANQRHSAPVAATRRTRVGPSAAALTMRRGPSARRRSTLTSDL